MKITEVCISDVQTLSDIRSSQNRLTVVLFLATWQRRDVASLLLVENTMQLLSEQVDGIFIVNVGNLQFADTMNVVIDDLDIFSLPAIAVFGSLPTISWLSLSLPRQECLRDHTKCSASLIYKNTLLEVLSNSRLLLSIISLASTAMGIQSEIFLNAAPASDIIEQNTARSKDVLSILFQSNGQFQQRPSLGALFIAGDKSSVGKSSICLGILSYLIGVGVPASSLAYIKPVTQCEAEQLVTRYCSEQGIACCGVGPVVFYKGFTRAFLAKETESSSELLLQATRAVEDIGRGKQLVLVDGVGYPSVGSICGISNADVAKALNAPVLLVGKSGVGDAVDSYNLNASFFESRGVHVLGGVFNKLPITGFYNLESCKEAVTSYFSQYMQGHRLYGFLPMIEKDIAYIDGMNMSAGFESQLVQNLHLHFNMEQLLLDLWQHQLDIKSTVYVPNKSSVTTYDNYEITERIGGGSQSSSTNINNNFLLSKETGLLNAPRHVEITVTASRTSTDDNDMDIEYSKKRSRDAIELQAMEKGATGG